MSGLSISEGGAASTSGDQTLAMLKLLADPAAFAALIKQFEDSKANADAAIALVGPAEHIPYLHGEAVRVKADAVAFAEGTRADAVAAAKDMTDTAAEILAQAREEAEKIKADASNLLAQAHADAADLTALAQIHADAAAAEHKTAADIVLQVQAEVSEKQKQLDDALAAAADAKAAHESAAADAIAVKTKLEAKVAAITAAVSDA